jgi:hypothetical protein
MPPLHQLTAEVGQPTFQVDHYVASTHMYIRKKVAMEHLALAVGVRGHALPQICGIINLKFVEY